MANDDLKIFRHESLITVPYHQLIHVTELSFSLQGPFNSQRRSESPNPTPERWSIKSRISTSRIAGMAACVLMLLSGLGLETVCSGDELSQLIIPAYGNPCCGSGQDLWAAMTDIARPGILDVILNPNSGPGNGNIGFNYINREGSEGPLIDLFAAGATLYGYVHTRWGSRDLSFVLSEIDRYLTPDFYRTDQALVGGIFLDEVSNDLANLNYYQAIKTHLISKNEQLRITGNPGTSALFDSSNGAAGFHPNDFVESFDKLVTYESFGHLYHQTFTTPAWVTRYPAERFAHIVHSADRSTMMQITQLADERNIGAVYITDDLLPNPYDRLPNYWSDLLTAVIPPVKIDELSEAIRNESTNHNYDLNQDRVVDAKDRTHWITHVAKSVYGDSNLDGIFNSADLIFVFQTGQYEDTIPLNAQWATGDWNGDGDFSSADFIVAFQAGTYQTSVRSVPEPHHALVVDWLIFAFAALRSGKLRLSLKAEKATSAIHRRFLLDAN